MSKLFYAICLGLMASGYVSSGAIVERAFAQCYPGLACPESRDAALAPPEKQRSYWTHNGSLVSLTSDEEKRSFRYENPREGVRAVGAERGALLFSGTRQGTNYAGTAYVFVGRCGAIPYAVRGSVSHDGRRVTLEGQAPNQVNQNCQVMAYRQDTLIFDFSH